MARSLSLMHTYSIQWEGLGTVAVFHSMLTYMYFYPYSSSAVPVLLAVLRVLLNLTHDNELGSHRLGEQEGAVKTVLDIVFLVGCVCEGLNHPLWSV